MNVTEVMSLLLPSTTISTEIFTSESSSSSESTMLLQSNSLLDQTSEIFTDTTTYFPDTTTVSPDFRTWLTDIVLKRSILQGSFWQGFLASLSVVIVSELGDKTFFIAAIMAMKHPRIIVFAGAISALVFMTILSAAFGWIATVIPRVYTYYISAALFAIFGLKMLRDGWKMDPNEGREELEEVQSELKRREDQEEKEETLDMLEQGQVERRRKRNAVIKVLLQAATLTFLAEWGDRSQLATVVLATREDAVGVVVGGSLGHALCTGLAVIGGRMVAQKISVRTVTIIGGIVFLFFAVSALFIGPGE
ncbi:putative divalent cation/proton antiporter TMEM165 isoform X3 [Plodia interpunctella]|uniref:putative divalent cation/proton antiporter TMEM165 isoform X3 n=1 Tax=Plodia interpunctella TaxID=58824 RepID=UPI002368E78E|nr:transmembrane protein 165 isoform X3 [Plodia interpunctella]